MQTCDEIRSSFGEQDFRRLEFQQAARFAAPRGRPMRSEADAPRDPAATDSPRRSWLDQVERLGNALPDPVAIFAVMIVVLMAVSAVGAALGWSAVHPVSGEVLRAKSLFAEDPFARLLTELPRTFAAFPRSAAC